MSETEYQRLDDKLTELMKTVATLGEKLADYPSIKEKVSDHDIRLSGIEQRCETVQDSKKNKQIPWGQVAGEIVVAIAMFVIGYFSKGA